MAPPLMEFLFLLAITAVVVRSYVRYLREPPRPTGSLGTLSRLVITGLGGLVCLSFLAGLLQMIAEFLR